MSGYNSIPKYISPESAARQAFGGLGYGSKFQSMKPDIMAWIADAQDEISRLKTYTDIPCLEFIVCNNKIQLPLELKLIVCATANGQSMTYTPTKGCDRCTWNSPNRCCNSSQFFYVDECYMHFKPMLADGVRINIDGLGRPIDSNGYPLVLETSILAVSDYIQKQLCKRYRDNRYEDCRRDWKQHCLRARAEANQFSNKDAENLGYIYHKVPYPVTFGSGGWPGLGASGGSLM